MSAPRTDAGKRLLAGMTEAADELGVSGANRAPLLALVNAHIALIEAEAASRSTPSLDAERLRHAMRNVSRRTDRFINTDRDYEAIVAEYARLSQSAAEETRKP